MRIPVKLKDKTRLTPMWTVKRDCTNLGSKWFDKSNMRFFNSRIPEYGIILEGLDLVWFVTSEAMSLDSVRKYSVRCFNPDTGSVETIGDFHSYKTQAAAYSALFSVLSDILKPVER